MPPHSIGSGTISFGLVSIPVRMYTAASSAGVSFNQLHGKCGAASAADLLPDLQRGGGANELVQGLRVPKDQYVQVHRRGAEGARGRGLDDHRHREFVPLSDGRSRSTSRRRTTWGPTRAARRPYRLLSDAMVKSGQVALAKYVMRGKENLVLIRPAQDGLMLHTMYFADEVRDFGEIDKGEGAKIKHGELDLALRLDQRLASDEFPPDSTPTSTATACSASSSRRSRARRSRRRAGRAARPGDRPHGRAQAEPGQARLTCRGCRREEAAHQGRNRRRRRETQGRRSDRTEEARAGRTQVTTTASSRML